MTALMREYRRRRVRMSILLCALACGPLASRLTGQAAQAPSAANRSPSPPPPDQSRITVEGIFGRNEFASVPMPEVTWLRDGRSYVVVRADSTGGSEIDRVDARTGVVTVLAPSTALVDSSGKRFTVESMRLSADEGKALLFHNSVRVWRSNTRGVYHVIDFATRRLTPLSTHPGLQMFAGFSPDGRWAAFVRENNLYVTELASGAERPLTTDGSAEIINGTTDWAYEEELGLREAFRWSPDSRRIAFWRFDQSSITPYPLVDAMSVNPRVVTLRYPLAGAPNSSVRVGVLEVPSVVGELRPPTWLDVGGDTGIYVTRMSWLGADSLLVQRLPRRQNRVDLLVRSAVTGQGRTLVSDADSAYVDAREQPMWVNGGREFLWMSDRSGWRQVYVYSRSGALVRQVTADGRDVLSIAGVDSAHASVYVEEAAPDATERQIYRYQLAGSSGGNSAAMAGVRVTPTAGSHTWTVAPGAHYAIDISSRLSDPPVATLIELPSCAPVRVMVDNAVLIRRMAALSVRPPDYIKVPMPDGTALDGWRIAPANFDSAKKYPVLMYVYGGPANPTVVDQWGGRNYLWHQSLAQLGYVVVSVDNRGAAWRGRDFRKVTQFRLGVRESQDQLDVARWLGRQSWGDATRIGIWGWSFGGYLTTMTAGQGGSLFKAAIAVAPVTDWRLYDSIYTERYDGTPQDNAAGYAAGSSQAQAGGLKATLLLVYGTGDDNVHPQNSLQYANALEAAGKDFTMILYPNRTHAISGGNSQAHLFESLTRFITEHL